MAKASQQKISALSSIGIDIGKDVFHLVGFGINGQIALRRQIKRLALIREFKKLPPCIVGMEPTRQGRSNRPSRAKQKPPSPPTCSNPHSARQHRH